MTTRSWTRTLFGRTPRTVRKAQASCRLGVEALEARTVPAVSFHPAVNYGTGGSPETVAVGDFNADGKLDLATANLGSSNLSVLLGNGNGTFQNATSHAAGLVPIYAGVGDFNGDGKQDLVAANRDSNNVSVLLGNGNGTFQPAVHYAAGDKPGYVAIGDFNGDSKQDLAVSNQGIDTVRVLLGNGNGTFQDAVVYNTGDMPVAVGVGDFNGDNKQDLAVTNISSSTVSVFLGNGNGTFQNAVNYGTAGNPEPVVVRDYNGDGKLDLATATYSGSVSVLLGNGNGTFQNAANFGAGALPAALAAGDFTGDGKLDLAAGNYHGHNVSVLQGNGDGTFQAAVNYATGRGPVFVAAGDFNADNSPDLAVLCRDSSEVSVLLNDPNFAPTDIALSNTSLAENQSSGTTVGAFSSTDPDTGDNHTYTLVSGTDSTDNASFTIDGGNLKTAASFNFEAKSSYSIRVQSTDAGGLTTQKVFTINVTNVNEAPTNIALSNSSLAENLPVGTVVGAFSTTDPDNSDGHNYTLVSGTGSTDNASFTIDGGNLKTAASFNFEAKSSYSIRVESTDAGGLTTQKAFTISVTNVNEAPSAVAGGPYVVPERETVQLLGAGSDVDAGDVLSYAWDLDNNGTFETTGQNVSFSASGITAPSSRTVSLRVTDALGLFADSSATVNIVSRPEMVSVTPSVVTITDAHIGLGTFRLTVVFDMSMNAAFAPTLSFPNEDPASTLLFSSGSWKTTNVLNDTYEVVYDVTDVEALFAGVAVKFEDGRDATYGFAPDAIEIPDVFAIKMNPPRVTAINAIKHDKEKRLIAYQVTFSETVTGVSLGDFVAKSTGKMNGSVKSVSGAGTTWFVKVKYQSARGTVQLQLHDHDTIQDLVGNLLGGKARRDGDFAGMILQEGMYPLNGLA